MSKEYIKKLELELIMSHMSDGWYVKWVKKQLEKYKN